MNKTDNITKTALITGASKGIGKEFAKVFASKNCNLVLVARSGDELQKLKEFIVQKYNVSVHLIVKDLFTANAVQEVFEEIHYNNIDIDYLVNNAGFGDYGEFVSTNWERYNNMINLNINVLTHLCKLFISDWKGRKEGKIINISSTAAFQPGPMMAVYFATKSYVLHFSEAIAKELENSGITVTAVCPGPTSTEFGSESGMSASKLVKNVKILDAADVARQSYDAMMRGKPVIINGGMNKIAPFFIRFLPRKWVTQLSYNIMREK